MTENGSTTNVLLIGVGGQGIILASRILSQAVLEAGFDVKQSEIHGMAQRGGSVSSHVRFGKEVHSPLIPYARADYVIATERLEALRYENLYNPKSVILVNDLAIDPPKVASGEMPYPADVIDYLAKKYPRVELIPAVKMAREIGNARAQNTIILGRLARYLGVDEKYWIKTMKAIMPAKILDDNIKAFRYGRDN